MTDAHTKELSAAERRRFILRGLLRAMIAAVVLLALYFLVPLELIAHLPQVLTITVAGAVLLAVTVWQLRAIIRSPQPRLREIEALTVIATLYLIALRSDLLSPDAIALRSLHVQRAHTRRRPVFHGHGVLHRWLRRYHPVERSRAHHRHSSNDPQPHRARCRRSTPDGRRSAKSADRGVQDQLTRRMPEPEDQVLPKVARQKPTTVAAPAQSFPRSYANGMSEFVSIARRPPAASAAARSPNAPGSAVVAR